ncbi:TPA: hypothetical protein P2Q98_000215 [Aeromonas veronii]|uniref:hypothetical protein n=1 Tax=Aeromonas veronii TaxID=654 RepID=UPI003308163A|nr:hypothetical protein [Aeromonas veronii]HDO1332128.1 hypothetical protein [Aeromonas veronii]HDO1339044.1 hypothetical protein [Aeromonas veronii]HDO1341187.1 hypothetical protein [Aeromonas veronii]HDO1345761.1 hypothetical protein [Aeromonas veronii]
MSAPKEKASFCGVKTAPFTHVNLLSGRKGRVVEQSDGEVVMQDEKGWAQSYDEDRLHLSWAALNSESQGEQS